MRTRFHVEDDEDEGQDDEASWTESCRETTGTKLDSAGGLIL